MAASTCIITCTILYFVSPKNLVPIRLSVFVVTVNAVLQADKMVRFPPRGLDLRKGKTGRRDRT